MEAYLIDLSTNHVYLVYSILIILGFLEGPFLSLICGVLLRLGHLFVVPVYVSLMIGDLIGDALWYYLGFRFGHKFVKRYGEYFSITEERVEKVTQIFHKYKKPILFISKISNGFGFALVTLFTAGMVRIPFGFYMFVNGFAQLVWTGMLLGVGYYFSNLYLTIDSVFGKVSIIAFGILVIVAFLGFRRYLQNKIK
ncbi:MAG: VTT domain-containing protein [Patescibacteria group bacterium]